MSDAASERDYLTGVGMALGAAILTSSAGLTLRFVEVSDGWDVLFVRSFGYFVFILVYIRLTNPDGVLAVLRRSNRYTLLGAAAMTVSQVCFIFALLNTTVAAVVLTMSSTPAVTAVLAFLLLRERLRLSTILIVLCSAVGVLVIAASQVREGSVLGVSLAGIACVALSLNLVCVKKQSSGSVTTYLWSAIFTLAIAFCLNPGVEGTVGDIILCLYMGVFALGLQHVLLAGALRRIEATFVGLLSRAQAILGPIWVALVIGEIPSVATVAGGGIIMAALAAETAFGLRHRRSLIRTIEQP